MKKLFTLIALAFISLSYSQDDDGCRIISAKGLNLVYRDVQGFNSYVKGGDFKVDNENKISAYYNDCFRDNYQRALLDRTRNEIYSVLSMMVKIAVFDSPDVTECRFNYIVFKTTYTTGDYQKIIHNFYISYSDMVAIKGYLNKDDVFRNLKQY